MTDYYRVAVAGTVKVVLADSKSMAKKMVLDDVQVTKLNGSEVAEYIRNQMVEGEQ